jgi:hypothetical protein
MSADAVGYTFTLHLTAVTLARRLRMPSSPNEEYMLPPIQDFSDSRPKKDRCVVHNDHSPIWHLEQDICPSRQGLAISP